MKTFLHARALVLLGLFAAASASAQISWQKVNGPNETMNTITATDDNELFLGSNNYGAFKSVDGGVSWEQENQGLPDIIVRNLQATTSNEVFAGTGSNGIYRYASGSWTAANNGLPSGNLLSYAFAKGTNGTLYMITTSDNLYKWDGSSWTSIKFNLPSLVRAVAVASDGTVFAGCFNSGVYKFNGVDTWATMGAMPNSFITRMVMSSSDMLFVACNSNNVYRIPATGGSWTSINTGLPTLNATVMGVDANDRLYLGYLNNLYGNLYQSVNNGSSWSPVSGSLFTSQFTGFAGAPNGDAYVCGSGVYKSATGGATWLDMNPGLDARKSIKSFTAAPNGTLFVGTQLQGVWRSTDNGYTWQQKNTGITTFYTDQVASTANGTILYSAYIAGSTTTGVIFRSANNGDTWTQVASNGTDHYTKIKQHLADTIWATGRFGGPVLSFSANNGATWVNHPINAFSAIWDIEFNAGSTIFLSSESEGITRSVDGGNSWTEGVGGSDAWYGNVIEVELDHNGYLFAGSDWYNNTLWFSPPGSNGNTWTKFLDSDLNGVADVYDLVFDVNNNAYLATGNTAYKDPIYMATGSAWNANTDWVGISTGLPSVAPVLELGFDPAGYMYSVFFETAQEGGLYRSTTPVNIPLPIKLVAFTGHRQNNDNVLNWHTASEQQNKQFEIERSTDGVHFETIGVVAAAGSSSTGHDYAFTDAGGATAAHYYRLRQLDFDGHATYSTILFLDVADADFNLRPNPVGDRIYFSKNLDFFEVWNLYGAKMLSNETVTDHIDVAAFPDGVYVLRTDHGVREFMVKHE